MRYGFGTPTNDDGADAPEPPVPAVEVRHSVEKTPLAPSSPSDDLRRAAASERREWGSDADARHYPVASAVHLALADLLDEFANAAQHLDDYDGFDPYVTIDGYGNALTIARLINGGAA